MVADHQGCRPYCGVRSSRVGRVASAFSKYTAAMLFYTTLWIPALVQFKMFEWVTHLPPAFTPGALGKVVFDVEGRPPRDAAAQARVDLAIQ